MITFIDINTGKQYLVDEKSMYDILSGLVLEGKVSDTIINLETGNKLQSYVNDDIIVNQLVGVILSLQDLPITNLDGQYIRVA